MPRAQKSTVDARPEGDSRAGHFLTGIYFVPMPDFNDETIWTINQGRAMPALIAVLRALHDQHRRGRTEEIRADAETLRARAAAERPARAQNTLERMLAAELAAT